MEYVIGFLVGWAAMITYVLIRTQSKLAELQVFDTHVLRTITTLAESNNAMVEYLQELQEDEEPPTYKH